VRRRLTFHPGAIQLRLPRPAGPPAGRFSWGALRRDARIVAAVVAVQPHLRAGCGGASPFIREPSSYGFHAPPGHRGGGVPGAALLRSWVDVQRFRANIHERRDRSMPRRSHRLVLPFEAMGISRPHAAPCFLAREAKTSASRGDVDAREHSLRGGNVSPFVRGAGFRFPFRPVLGMIRPWMEVREAQPARRFGCGSVVREAGFAAEPDCRVLETRATNPMRTE
jgi:hypothetical protein